MRRTDKAAPAGWSHRQTSPLGRATAVASLAVFCVATLVGCTSANSGAESSVATPARASTDAAAAPSAEAEPSIEPAAPSDQVADPTPDPAATTPLPTMEVTCPPDAKGSGDYVDASFGYDINAVEPYTVMIDYGDDKAYRDNQNHLRSVFTHRYTQPWFHWVTATLTDPAGQTAVAQCLYTWWPLDVFVPDPTPTSIPLPLPPPMTPVPLPPMPPLVTPVPLPPGSGYTVTCGDGSLSGSGGIRGACSHHGGVGG